MPQQQKESVGFRLCDEIGCQQTATWRVVPKPDGMSDIVIFCCSDHIRDMLDRSCGAISSVEVIKPIRLEV